jgi:hypothetical protein
VSRSAQDRLTDIQTAIARVYAYRPSLKGEHSEDGGVSDPSGDRNDR